jgi:hypothetical protein
MMIWFHCRPDLVEEERAHRGDRLIKQFADPLTPVQSQILQLLSIPTAVYGPGKQLSHPAPRTQLVRGESAECRIDGTV